MTESIGQEHRRQKSAKSTTASGKTSKGFTDEERAAMKEHVQELKSAAAQYADKADGESACAREDRRDAGTGSRLGERLHAIIKASAPALSPRLWYGMPAYAKDGKVVCFFQSTPNSRRGTPRSASSTMRTSTKAACGRPPSH